MPSGGMTLDQMFGRIERSLLDLQRVPENAIAEADKTLMVEAPTYTGTYKEAIRVEAGTLGPHSFEVSLTPGMLQWSAGQNATRFQTRMNRRGVLGDPDAQAALRNVAAEVLAESYIHENIHGLPPDGLYPLRIERYGGPKTGEGQDMWAHAADDAARSIRRQMQQIARRATQ